MFINAIQASLSHYMLIASLQSMDSNVMAHITGPVFDSEEAAVKVAAAIYNPVSIRENREYIGAIKFGLPAQQGYAAGKKVTDGSNRPIRGKPRHAA